MTTYRARGALTLWLGGPLLACTPADEGQTEASETTAATSSSTELATGPGPTSGAASTDDGGTGGTSSDGSGPTSSTGPGETAATDTTTEPSTGDSSGGDDGLGTLEGECGLIDAMELSSPSAFVFGNAIDFRDLGFDYDQLTPQGQQVFDAGNLGGNSLYSEVISFEVLARCDGASLVATEAEIEYLDPMGIKTDLLVELDGLPVGVSVTRAVAFPFEDPYTVMQAEELLTDKLGDILASTANVAPSDAWIKQILHVIAYADMHADSIVTAYEGLPPELTGDTILLVTVTHGNDEFVY